MLTATRTSPTEEAVRIIPLFGLIEVEARQPSLLRFSAFDGGVEALQNRCRAAHPLVGQQPRHRKRSPAERPLQIALFVRVELPRNELAENDVRVSGFRRSEERRVG